MLARLVRDSTSAPFAMVTSSARRPMYRKYGELHFTLQGQPLTLSVYQSQEPLTRPDLADYLFLLFTDGTNGHGSYGGRLTPHEFVCAQWQNNPAIFTRDPTQLTLGLYK